MSRHLQIDRRSFRSGDLLGCGMVFVAVLLMLAGAANAQFHVQLSPQLVEAEVKPGSRGVLEFELMNSDRVDSVDVLLSLSSITQGINGQYSLTDSLMPNSCAEWLELPDSIITIPPGATRTVRVSLRVPSAAVGGGYGAVVFEMLPPEEHRHGASSDAAKMRYRFKMPAWLELSIDRTMGVRKRLLANQITITRTADDSKLKEKYGDLGMRVSVDVENTGNVHVFTTGRLLIRDENHRLIKDTRLGSGRGAVLPSAVTALQTITDLPRPGKYTVKAFVEYGGRSPATVVTTLDVGRKYAGAIGGSVISMPLEVEIVPAKVELSAPGRATRPFGATLVNREAFPIHVEVRSGQIYHDAYGKLWTTDNADSARSIADWITFEPKEFTINPNRRQNVRVMMNVPDTAAGGYYGCLQFTATAPDSIGSDFLPSELKLPIYVSVPPELAYACEITKVGKDVSSGGGVTLMALLENNGNIHVTARGAAIIEKWAEGRIQVDGVMQAGEGRFQEVGRIKINADSVLIFPGESRILTSETIDQLPPGKYRAKLEVFYGAKQPATMEKEFLVEPPREN